MQNKSAYKSLIINYIPVYSVYSIGVVPTCSRYRTYTDFIQLIVNNC